MDTKALAKSKRAHSQHHSKKPHRIQASKGSAESGSGSGLVKKPLGKQVGDRTQKSQVASALPSNWDRYEDDFISVSEGSLGDSASQPSDVIVPKSKGADYLYLITEAESQSNLSLDNFPSLDDFLPDFNEGLGFMLSIRGESIRSRVEHDNFVVEDRETRVQEASYFSLNLHALAEQLGKVELSKRLFIEADLLPPELLTEGLVTRSNKESEQIQETRGSKIVTSMTSDLATPELSEKTKIKNEQYELTSTDMSDSGFLESTLPNRGSYGLHQINSDTRQVSKSTELNVNVVANSKNSTSTFKAAAAEEELDMLLNSFSETNFLDSSTSGYAKTVLEQDYSTAAPLHSSKITANIDDFLDDLLEEASIKMNQSGLWPPEKVKVVTQDVQISSSSGSGTNSKVLDDLDSWLDTI